MAQFNSVIQLNSEMKFLNLASRLLFLLLFTVTSSHANQFDDAVTLYDQQKYVEARKLWEAASKLASDKGAAFFRIADLYRNGLGHKEHHGRAAYWYQQSAEKGYVPAMYQLGLLHHRLGDDSVRNTKSAVLWWEKAAAQGDGKSQMELALFYSSDTNEDTVQALKFARAAAAQNIPESFNLLSKIDSKIESLAIGGTARLSAIDANWYTLALASFDNFNSAWNFIVDREIKNASIHQSVYEKYDVTVGSYKDIGAAYAGIKGLRKDLLKLHPVPQRMEAIQHTLIPIVSNFDQAWVREAGSRSYSVELYRTNSRIDAQNVVNKIGLKDSAIYETVLAESVVITGVYDSYSEAQAVSDFVPEKLGLVKSKVVKFSEVQAELTDKRRVETEVQVAAAQSSIANEPVVSESGAIVLERELAVSEQERALTERERTVSDREQAVSEQEQAVAQQQLTVSKQERAVSELKLALSEQERAVSEREVAVSELEPTVSEREQAVAAQLLAVSNQERALSEQKLVLSKLERTVSDRELAISELEPTVSELQLAVSARALALSEQERVVSQRELAISELEPAVSARELAVSERERVVSERERKVSEQEVAVSKLEPIVPEPESVALEPEPTQTAAATELIASKPMPQEADSKVKSVPRTQEAATVNEKPTGDHINKLFSQANDWLANADSSAYVLQVATISKRTRIERVLASLKQKYPQQPVHVFDQRTPEYYYFYVGLFDSLLAATDGITELKAKGSVVRNIGDSKKRRCANRVKEGEDWKSLGYCN